MNGRLLPLIMVVFAATVPAGADPVDPAIITSGTIDAGGSRMTSSCYTVNATIGGPGCEVTGGNMAIHAGFAGQLTDIRGLAVTSNPVLVDETNTCQLTGAAVMDDDSVTALEGPNITWLCLSPAVSGITEGVLTAGIVYTATLARVEGRYLGMTGSTSVLILDDNPDNFGSYAGDNLPDWWQTHYFGLNNQLAAPDVDLFGSGENNLFKYVAGLCPTNPAAVFTFRIAPTPGQAGQMNLIFEPHYPDRTYTLLFRNNLADGAFMPLTWTRTNAVDNAATITDLNATNQTRFYRIRITYP